LIYCSFDFKVADFESAKTCYVDFGTSDEGFFFRFEDGTEECLHPLPLEKTTEFMAAFGQPDNADLVDVIQGEVAQGHARRIHEVVHKLLPASFTWRSTDWTD
jgi:hypothetical protein